MEKTACAKRGRYGTAPFALLNSHPRAGNERFLIRIIASVLVSLRCKNSLRALSLRWPFMNTGGGNLDIVYSSICFRDCNFAEIALVHISTCATFLLLALYIAWSPYERNRTRRLCGDPQRGTALGPACESACVIHAALTGRPSR